MSNLSIITFFHLSIYAGLFPLVYSTHDRSLTTRVHVDMKQWISKADPEQYMNVSEIIAYHGYPVEEHTVLTEDGYILSIQRIPYGITNHQGKKRLPVLMVPGITCTSALYVFNVPDKNLAYQLADAGYDVWLSNFRGSKYGLLHVNLTIDEPSFWNFSFHEMGYYDIPATIDYILQETKTKEMNYVCLSMGCSIALVTLSTKIEYNDKIQLVVMFGPASGMKYLSGPLHYFALGENLMNFFPTFHFVMPPYIRFILSNTCRVSLFRNLCRFAMYVVGGLEDMDKLNVTRFPVYVSHIPDTTSSVKNFLHFAQLQRAGFRMYDFGEKKNHIAYGEASPPEYKLNQITTTTAIFWNEGDTLTTILDVHYLMTQLDGHVISFEMPGKFAHPSYISRIDATTLVYTKVLKLFDEATNISSIHKDAIHH